MRSSLARPWIKALPAAFVLALSGVASSGTALAQQPAPPLDPVAAEAADQFMAGRDALKKGDLQKARDLFRRSQELRPAAGTILNLAAVEEQLGELATAVDLLQTAVKLLPDGDDRVPLAKESLTRLAPRVPYFKIEMAAGAPASTHVALDGAPFAASWLGAEQAANPGSHEILVTAPDHEPRRYELKLGEGQHVALIVEPGKAAGPQGIAAPGGATSRPSWPLLTGYTLGGVGVAGLVIGAVTGGLAMAKKSDLDNACPAASPCGPEGLQAEAAGKALAGVSTASFIAGVAGLGAGVTLVLLSRDPKKASKPAASIFTTPRAGGAMLGASVSF